MKKIRQFFRNTAVWILQNLYPDVFILLGTPVSRNKVRGKYGKGTQIEMWCNAYIQGERMELLHLFRTIVDENPKHIVSDIFVPAMQNIGDMEDADQIKITKIVDKTVN